MPIGERWLMENPQAALDWYARIASKERGDSFEDGGSAMDSSKDDATTSLKLDLLESAYDSHEDRMNDVCAALERLISAGDSDLVVRFVGKKTEVSLASWDLPLIDLVRKIPASEVRNSLFLKIARAIPVRGDSDSSLNPSEPNVCLNAVRDLSTRLDLPDGIRAEVEEAFRNVEARELEALEKQEEWRRRK